MYKGMLMAALIACLVLSFLRRKQAPLPLFSSLVVSILLIVYGVLGARALGIIESGDISASTYSFFGALYMAPLGLFVTAKILKISPVECINFYGLYVPIILAILRIGCFIEGCCGAGEITVGSKTVTPPIQLIESGCDLIIFALLFIQSDILYKKNKPERPALIYAQFALLYSFIRLVMENYRLTQKDIAGMSEGQWLSILTFVVSGVILYIYKNKTNKKCLDITELPQ